MTDWIEVNDTVLRYEYRPAEQGQPTLVLVHEMGGTLESWDEFVAELPPGFGVLRYDLRGAGLSEKLHGAIELPLMSHDLQELVARIDPPGPLVVVGCALGAAIAFRFAGISKRCAAAIGLSAVTATSATFHPVLLGRADRIEAGRLREVVEEALAVSFPPTLRSDAVRFARQRARWLSNDPHSLAATYRMLPSVGEHAVLDRIDCPVLLVAASRDTIFSPEVQRETAKLIKRAEVLEIDTGHFPSVISPAATATAVEHFLDRLIQGSSR